MNRFDIYERDNKSKVCVSPAVHTCVTAQPAVQYKGTLSTLVFRRKIISEKNVNKVLERQI